jgi:mgtE-like transporter
VSVDSGSGEDLPGLAADLAETYEELGAEALDDWSTRTMVPLLVALSVLQMVSGSVLDAYEGLLLENPSLLILVPVQIGTAGSLGSIMCSRLSTQLHLGTFEFSADNPDVRANVGAVLGLGATVFVLVGVAAWAIGRALGGRLALSQVMCISLVSGMLLAGFVVVVSLRSGFSSYRLGYNPDDTTIPVVTNVCDITGVLILFGTVSVVL